MPKDYYLVLGITSDATPYDIKDAYRKRVKEFHPDHYGGEHSEFLAIQEAYSVLSDPIKRQTHDLEVLSQKRKLGPRYGERMRPGPRRHVEPLIPENKMPIDLEAASLARSFHTYGSSFDELFDIIFSNFRETARSKSEGLKNRNVVITGHFRISDII
ncbi:J domain-containing protein [Desulfobacter vibrioformis]|uniref:J domain-containing protein n=1 Tax=Desulfobacter vibrioformis TaxID=34031 RepID=UPI000A01DAF2|nr:DnaJ domain-containing protein [Desulfobacter vibrioformis]